MHPKYRQKMEERALEEALSDKSASNSATIKLVGVIISLVAAGFLYSEVSKAFNGDAATSVASLSSAREQQERPARVGEAIPLNHGLEAIFQPAEAVSRFGEPYMSEKASEGGVLVVVQYSLRNASSAPVSAGDIPDVKLVDGAGVLYSPDLGKSAMWAMNNDIDQKAWSDLNPGITVRNAQVFEVSKSAYESGSWWAVIDGSNRKVTLKLAGY